MSQWNQNPQQTGYPQQAPPKRLSWLWIVLGILGGGSLLVVLLCAGTIFWMTRVPRGSSASRNLNKYDSIPVPTFADRSESEPFQVAAGVSRIVIPLGEQGGYYSTPGMGGMIWVYLPAGEHAMGSLPCVLMAASRYSVDVGAALDSLDEDEYVTYAQAGFVVVAYELDGRNDAEMFNVAAEQKQFAAFADSCAGMVNARNAFQCMLQRFPEVNPQQIFTAGIYLSSIQALLFAEHEPRIAGVVAIAPTIDVPAHLGVLLLRSNPQPGFIDFATQSSPSTHVKQLKSSVFIYLEEEDEPLLPNQAKEIKAFVAALKKQGTDATLMAVKSEFNGRVDEGIQPSIKWLKEQIAK